MRVQIGYEDVQPFLAPCPNCQSMLRGVFEPNRIETLTSNHITAVQGGPQDPLADYPTLNIAVDLPMFMQGVHKRGPLTPFMAIYRLIDTEQWMQT
ncbi:MAG: hypothetical protein WC876_03700, partial [Candidatus Thermoplasmatota archaeon]